MNSSSKGSSHSDAEAMTAHTQGWEARTLSASARPTTASGATSGRAAMPWTWTAAERRFQFSEAQREIRAQQRLGNG